MTRTEAEKYETRRYQDRHGRWHTSRELIHDTRYCDLCDSEDIEPMDALPTVNGWYGGIRISWHSRGGVHGAQVVEVMCRACREQHHEAYHTAERRPVEVADRWGDVRTRDAYYCPAHKHDHYEDRLAREAREAEEAEIAEFVR